MEHDSHDNEFTYPGEWVSAPSLDRDGRDRFRCDTILDFGYWCKAGNIRIAGKADAPDPEAMRLAGKVATDLDASLAKLKAQYPYFKISEDVLPEVDEWRLDSLDFPYQTLGSCWFVIFVSEYGAFEEFCFRHADSEADAVVECREPGTFSDKILSARYCIREMHRQCMGDKDFAAVIERIRTERLVGPELVEPLLRILAKDSLGLKESTVGHLRKMLTRDPVRHRRETEVSRRERERKAQQALKRDA